MIGTRHGGAPSHPALRDAEPSVFWLDRPERPESQEPLVGGRRADLAVVGAGFCGLWTALRAKERDPALDVAVLESHEAGWAASGRNGGFCVASLTHGRANGMQRFPAEMDVLDRMGADNLDGIEATLGRYGIDCDWERTGELTVAVAPWQAEALADEHAEAERAGAEVVWLDGPAVRSEIHSPTYVAGSWSRRSGAVVDPARLAWGLRRACLHLGVRIHEHTPVDGLEAEADSVVLRTPAGSLRAARVALATNAFPALLRRWRPFTVPVYDHVLVTEPLGSDALAAVGWANRQGVGDAANQFHYYRLTADQRILWGGYDAIYHAGGAVRPEYDQRAATSDRLAEHFFETFPQLAGTRFTHRWGGAIDTCSRFFAFYDTALGGKVAYAAGFTGLGVAATRFAADVLLDLLHAPRGTERTRLEMVRRRPVPFPPEPLASAAIQLTRWSLAAADRREGRRNAWLRTLDRFGLGFDS